MKDTPCWELPRLSGFVDNFWKQHMQLIELPSMEVPRIDPCAEEQREQWIACLNQMREDPESLTCAQRQLVHNTLVTPDRPVPPNTPHLFRDNKDVDAFNNTHATQAQQHARIKAIATDTVVAGVHMDDDAACTASGTNTVRQCQQAPIPAATIPGHAGRHHAQPECARRVGQRCIRPSVRLGQSWQQPAYSGVGTVGWQCRCRVALA
jgi:hypothetical protein